jgi:hypothetical protein
MRLYGQNVYSDDSYIYKVFECESLEEIDLYFENVAAELQIPTVPIVERDVVLTQELIDKYAKELKKLNGKMFEGVVVKHSSGTFKIINKNYDSKK